jgi:hypothetical protein
MAEYTTPSGLVLPGEYGEFQMARGVPEETANCLREVGRQTKEGSCRSRELLELCQLFDNSPELALDPNFRPKPDGMDYTTWEDLNARIFVMINLVKTHVRVFRTNVYATGGRRSIKGSPYAEQMQKIVGGKYPRKCAVGSASACSAAARLRCGCHGARRATARLWSNGSRTRATRIWFATPITPKNTSALLSFRPMAHSASS